MGSALEIVPYRGDARPHRVVDRPAVAEVQAGPIHAYIAPQIHGERPGLLRYGAIGLELEDVQGVVAHSQGYGRTVDVDGVERGNPVAYGVGRPVVRP